MIYLFDLPQKTQVDSVISPLKQPPSPPEQEEFIIK